MSDISAVGRFPQRVYTADQASRTLGVERETVAKGVRRARERGVQVSWAPGEGGNELPCTLVLESWVRQEAVRREGILVELSAMIIVLDGLAPDASAPRQPDQGPSRTARVPEQMDLSEALRAEAHAEQVRRLEVERELAEARSDTRAAQDAAATARADAERAWVEVARARDEGERWLKALHAATDLLPRT